MKWKIFGISLALAGAVACGDDGGEDLPPPATEENEIAGAAICDAEVRDYSMLENGVRFPWAGEERFYRMSDEFCPTTDSILRRVEVTEEDMITDAKVIISPHAGWQFSGIHTVEAFARVEIPDLVILVGNNHKDNGEDYAVYPEGAWALPTGNVPVDATIAQQLIDDVGLLTADASAHSEEHSNEVQTMWLHRFNPDVRIVPVAIDGESDVENLLTVGEQIAASLQKIEEPYLVVATTDLTHYQTRDVVAERDNQMIAEMMERDAQGLYELVAPQRSTMSMCGLEPVTTAIQLANSLGATEAIKVRQGTSGDVLTDAEEVVGYVSIIFR